MQIRPLAVPGSFLIEPDKLSDARGCFYESFVRDELASVVGHPFNLAQSNFSVSRRNVIRGIHGVLIPPGQAKIVTCHRGALLDMVVDIRLGSPTFGVHDSNVLDAQSGRSVYVAEGLGHGFVALTDDCCIGYLCSTRHVPGTQLDINPFDEELDLPWRANADELIASDKDAGAPSIALAAKENLLPTYDECRALYRKLASE